MNKKIEFASLGTASIVMSVLSWIFVPEDFYFIYEDHPKRAKLLLVSIIFVVVIIWILAKLVWEKKKELEEKEREYQYETDTLKQTTANKIEEIKEKYTKQETDLIFQYNALQQELEIEKKKYANLEKNSKAEIDDLKIEMHKKESECSIKIQGKETIITNLNQEKSNYAEQIVELQRKIRKMEADESKKYDILLKEKEKIEEKMKNTQKELQEKKDQINILCTKFNKLHSIDSINSWRHTVLIIDDSAKVIKDLKRRLEDMCCDIVYLNRLEDYRLVENFEIIISDILDCSPGDDAILTLNTIKKQFPYKFVIAMSSAPAECHGLEVDGNIIEKETIGIQYVKVIRERITECMERLDNPVEHWDNVYHSLLSKYKSRTKKIESIKANYIATLKRLSSIIN